MAAAGPLGHRPDSRLLFLHFGRRRLGLEFPDRLPPLALEMKHFADE